MESLLYKTPSPVTAKRRLSGIPVKTIATPGDTSLGPPERVPNNAVRRIVSSGGGRDAPWRRGSFSGSSDVLNRLDEDAAESVDSSMGFRELERKHIAKIKRQNFDLKLELHLRRERMTANAEKIHRAEKLVLENDELRETLRETRATLKTREDEIADCRSLIRLLSDQLEAAHKRIAALTEPRKSPPSISIPSPTSDGMSRKDTPTSESSAFADGDDSIVASPISLMSLESGIRSLTDEEATDSTVIKFKSETPVDEKECAESIHEIHLPPQLEHSPRTTRTRSMLDQISQLPTPHSTPYYDDHHRGPVLPSKHKPKLVTPVVTRVNAEISKTRLPPTPEETPLPMKQATQRATLRARIFRSKSDLNDSTKAPSTVVEEQPTPLPTTTKSVTKKNSLMRFWKSKCSSKGEEQKKSSTTTVTAIPTPTPTTTTTTMKKAVSVPPTTPAKREENPTPFTAPHESDKLSRYPKARPTTSYTTTRSTTTTTTTTNPDWRRSVGRQVSEMVQHWEHESTTRRDRPLSCAAYVSSKQASSSGAASLKDFGVSGASPMAVRAARDAWTARKSSTGNLSRSSSLRSVAAVGSDGLRRRRDELVRKLGLASAVVAAG